MTVAQTVRCKACNGTGVAMIADDKCRESSQNALLRSEVAGAWGAVAVHERFLKSIYETSQDVITGLVKKLAKNDDEIAEQ